MKTNITDNSSAGDICSKHDLSIIDEKVEGLYDPQKEHDSCGLGFIANIKGKKSHKIIENGIKNS